MSLAYNAGRDTSPCPPTAHPHPIVCEGCKEPVCGPDDGWVTTTGRRYVCDPCVEKARRQWMKGSCE